MKVLIDTNIIISAALFPNGKAAQALNKALVLPFEPVLCDYVIDEVHRKFIEKWPYRITELEAFLFKATQSIDVVQIPEEEEVSESEIRDFKDRPILRAALNEHADYLLTGDRDFLESSIKDPRVISVTDFLDLQPPALLSQFPQSDSLVNDDDQVHVEISIHHLRNDDNPS